MSQQVVIQNVKKCLSFPKQHQETYRALKSMDTAKYFQNGLAEIVEIRHTVRSVEILSFDIF
jgi:hypothetical protein